MPRTERMKLGEFFGLVPEEQNMMLMFHGMFVEGTQEAISSVTSLEINSMHVVSVEADGGYLKVWVKDENE